MKVNSGKSPSRKNTSRRSETSTLRGFNLMPSQIRDTESNVPSSPALSTTPKTVISSRLGRKLVTPRNQKQESQNYQEKYDMEPFPDGLANRAIDQIKSRVDSNYARSGLQSSLSFHTISHVSTIGRLLKEFKDANNLERHKQHEEEWTKLKSNIIGRLRKKGKKTQSVMDGDRNFIIRKQEQKICEQIVEMRRPNERTGWLNSLRSSVCDTALQQTSFLLPTSFDSSRPQIMATVVPSKMQVNELFFNHGSLTERNHDKPKRADSV